ncbi:hypothetical protein [Treponema sp.]|uniref:hypothetical protein n=1 Tax=Treponema sp. TaxID=166 RepID=UPI00388D0C18
MSSFPKRLSPFFLFLIVFFFSCANDNPESSFVDYRVVYDFSDNEVSPELKLSVFVSVESNVRMGSSLKLIHEDSGLEWKCSSRCLNKIDMNSNKWIGSTNFIPVKNDSFPKGNYKVIYEDMAERECDVSFNMLYPDGILECTAKDIPTVFKTPAVKKIAVYSNEDVLLYFGEEPSHWRTGEDIIMEYKNAWCTRTCYTLNKDSVYCLMPPVELGNKNYVKESNREEN